MVNIYKYVPLCHVPTASSVHPVTAYQYWQFAMDIGIVKMGKMNRFAEIILVLSISNVKKSCPVHIQQQFAMEN